MGLFTKRKKCSCGANNCSQSDSYNEGDIAVLGSGCPKCLELEKNVNLALQELKIVKKVKHITDMSEIAQFGVMSTPALVIDSKVVAAGKVLSTSEVKGILLNEK